MKNKQWFEDNVTLNVTKLRLSYNFNECVTVFDMSDEFVFTAYHDSGEINQMPYSLDWEKVSEILNVSGDTETIKLSYYAREIDGQNFYRKKRAELASGLFSGKMTAEEVFFIDSKIKNTKDCLMTGDWMTGKEYLNAEVVEGVFTQEFKDYLIADLDSYINDNY